MKKSELEDLVSELENKVFRLEVFNSDLKMAIAIGFSIICILVLAIVF